jgi:hypothetical protein
VNKKEQHVRKINKDKEYIPSKNNEESTCKKEHTTEKRM